MYHYCRISRLSFLPHIHQERRDKKDTSRRYQERRDKKDTSRKTHQERRGLYINWYNLF